MDSLGAAVGICCIARKRGKPCQIIIDTENNAAPPILRRFAEQSEYAQRRHHLRGGCLFKCQPGALLVVVDTNRPESVESEEMLETCNRVAVIDHHRRGSSYIEKMALNYHEPYASSASELVTELMQYLVEPGDVLKCEAEALLAGIVLDTKNFTNRTGGRTFEAAAYLRRLGADTQDVQRMFQGDLNSMIARYDIIRQAELYHDDMAVVALDEECDRVTAAKAADELLTLKGIRASFVLYKKGTASICLPVLWERSTCRSFWKPWAAAEIPPPPAARPRTSPWRRPRPSCWRPSTAIWKTNVKETYRHERSF